jgi:hypothetical protein
MAIGLPGLLEWIIILAVVAAVAIIIITRSRRSRDVPGFTVLPPRPPPRSPGGASVPGDVTSDDPSSRREV